MSQFGTGALRGVALALCSLALMCISNAAYAQAGTILATNGLNQIQRTNQTISPLKPGAAVQARDTLVTEPNGRLQVRFVDGAIVSMQPGTQFRIDQHQFKKEESSSFFTLLRGAVRMASGLIGKKEPEQFRLSTPSATIGIRGTHFVVEHTVCDPDCAPGNKAGTRVAVTQGNVMVSNASGSVLLGANQSAFVSDENSPPLSDSWTPELAPRTVPPAPANTGPRRSSKEAGAAEPESEDSRDGTADAPTGSEQPKPVDRGTDSGIRWQPDQIGPFDPVREIALVDTNLPSANSPSRGEFSDGTGQPGNFSGSDQSGELDGDEQQDTAGDPDSNDSGAGNNNQYSNDSSGTNSPNGNNSGSNNSGSNGDDDVADVTDPPDVTDPGVTNPEPLPAPQTGSSIASSWYLDLRPMPNLIQQGLLADPNSAVIFDQGIRLESIGRCNGGVCLSRGSAMVADAGHDEYAAWGRWTNGQMHLQVLGLTQPITLSENEGLHYVVGSPALTIPTQGSFSYNLTAATAPTMNNDWYSPGSFSGQASVRFAPGAAPRVGLDAQVNFANDQFHFNTTGGAADPSQSELTLDSNLQFSGRLDANGGHQVLPWMCGSAGCSTRVEGGLFGPTGERLGVSYSIQGESGSTRINGVGIFSRP